MKYQEIDTLCFWFAWSNWICMWIQMKIQL